MENNQHVQLPIKTDPLQPKDKLIYCALKKYGEQAFPSLRTVADYLHISVDKVRDSIKNLVNNGYITITKNGRRNIYNFNPYKKFEMFSYKNPHQYQHNYYHYHPNNPKK